MSLNPMFEPRTTDRVPRAFTLYASAVGVLAVVALAGFMLPDAPDARPASLTLWVLAAFVLIGELLPIPVPRRYGLDRVTISTAFAFAVLLMYGVMPAMIVYAGASMIADALQRTAPEKLLFNGAQFMLTVAAAGLALLAVGDGAPVALTASTVPAVLVAAVAFFAANHVLAGIGAALLMREKLLPYLRDDLLFQAVTEGCLLAFAPAVVAAAQVSGLLVPLAFCPTLAIYFGGREAADAGHRASHDALTGLPNRALLLERLQRAVAAAEREHTSAVVMIADLDEFKTVNDTLGHGFGDRVLAEVAARLSGVLDDTATLGRLGGDEFAVALARVTDEAEAVAVAERLTRALERPLKIDGLSIQAATSIGIACFPQHGRTVAELLQHADVALYCAKAAHTDCTVYAEEDDEYTLDRLALAGQLRRGIDRGELVVHYQPKIPLDGSRTRAVEALVRWDHPQLGRIGPDGFVPLAEQTGLIKPLTLHVLDAALRQSRDGRDSGLELRVSVNISTRSLVDQDLATTICELLERYELPPSALQLEITESRIVSDPRRARSTLDNLRSTGVTIAIDDFGTGFSSLSQLQQLPVDEIKIDKSFVMRMESDPSDFALVRSIVELGRNLGLHITAEGVESESASRRLTELGCTFGQGFHFARPEPAADCARAICARNSKALRPEVRVA
jgi:diguanylate cyclase (GGDEF)-like protein